MKKKIVAILALALTACVLLSSCESKRIVNTVDSLLTPPLYYTEYEGLVDKFNEYVQTKPVFCSPITGDYNSAITVEDVDSDGYEEAVVIYRENTGDNFASVCFLENSAEGWTVVNSFSGYGNEVNSINIDDIDGDNNNEVMITWSYSGISLGYVLAVYGQDNVGKFKELTNQSCDSSDIIDIDNDGANEIFIISSSTDKGVVSRFAKVIKFENGKVSVKGKVGVDPTAVSYNPIIVQNRDENQPPILYIDAIKSDKQMITEMIFWDSDSHKLVNPFFDDSTGTNSITLRNDQISTFDVNDDGFYEIPIQVIYSDEDPATRDGSELYLTEWTDYSSITPKKVMRTLVNVNDGYIIDVSKLGFSKFGVNKYDSRNCWILYIDDGKTKYGNEIFSVIKISSKRWKTENFSSYIPVIESPDGVVCVYPTEKGKSMGYDKKDYSKMIFSIK